MTTSSVRKIDIGKEISAYCSKCKAETVHVITKIENDTVKKVYCKTCNSTHRFKTTDDLKKALSRSTATGNKKPRGTRGRASWSSLVATIDDEKIVNYDISKDFTSVEAIRHKTFGVGVITKVLDKNKIEVVFELEKKVLAQNWE